MSILGFDPHPRHCHRFARRLGLGFALLLASTIVAGLAMPGPRQAQWREVEQAVRDGLPQTAIDRLEPLIAAATAEGALAESLNAICKKILLEATIQGNQPEEKITRLERTLASATPRLQPMLKLVLARWYREYHQRNRWRFLNRTATARLDATDFTTWDLPRLYTRIDALYQEVLRDESALQAIGLADFAGFLQLGDQRLELRPTLFDFAAHEAIGFYASGEQVAARPADAFDVESSSPALGPADEFVAWQPTTSDRDSPKLRVICIFQSLLAFHRQANRVPAAVDVDLHRLQWARNVAVGETAGDRYRRELRRLADQHRDLDLAGFALALLARDLQQEGRLVDAHAAATEGSKRTGSPWSTDCNAILSQIEARELALSGERVLNPNTPGGAKVLVSYRNLEEVHFRVVADNWRERLESRRGSVEWLDWQERKHLLNRKPTRTWRAEVPGTPDFTRRQEWVAVPKLDPGFYWLIASWRDDFGERHNSVQAAPIWVTDLAMVSRTRAGLIEGVVTHHLTGEPIARAEVRAWHYDHRSQRGYELAAVFTDADGRFTLPRKADQHGITLSVSALGQELYQSDALSTWSPSEPMPGGRAFLFTDRAIYRPGQTIRAKILLVRVDPGRDDYRVMANHQTRVRFDDVNGKEIRTEAVRTNDFGTAEVSFTAPTDRLPGAMRLSVQDPHGITTVRVEEYKRPKFKVTLEPPADGARLGLPVTVKGEAVGYNGAPLDGATVQYRLTRQVRMPWWWFWWGAPPAQPSQELGHGTVQTTSDGKFSITFTARPDPKVPESQDPSFVFAVSADVTDTTGETRSANTSIRVGYTALEARVGAERWQTTGQPVEFTLTTATLDGQGVPARGSLTLYRLVEPDRPIPVRLFPSADGKPDPADCRGWENAGAVAERDFATDEQGRARLSVPLPAGTFRAVAQTVDRYGKQVTGRLEVTVLDPAAKAFPSKMPFRVAIASTTLEPGDTLRLIWGSGYPEARAFIEIEHRRKLLHAFWTDPGRTQQEFTMPVTEAMRGGFTARILQIRDGRLYCEQQRIDVPWSNRQLQLSFAHFRDKLQPGARETWTVTVQRPKGAKAPIDAEMVAALYDGSLDAFVRHAWPGLADIFRREDGTISQHFANRAARFEHLVSPRGGAGHVTHRTWPGFPPEISGIVSGYDYLGGRFDAFGADDEGGRGPRKLAVRQSSNLIAPAPVARAPAPPPPAPGAPMEADKARSRSEFAGDGSGGGGEGPESDAGPNPETAALDQVTARANLQETAFFMPHLLTAADGSVQLEFTIPEALTTWNFIGFAHTANCESGSLSGKTITQKELMVQPNPPRFLREGDQLAFTAKLTNLTDQPLRGKVRLTLSDPLTERARTGEFGVTDGDQEFTLEARASKSVAWTMKVPDGAGVLGFKVVAAADAVSDGEQGLLPVLSRRILVHEALPLPIRGPATRRFAFKKLLESGSSDTLRHQGLTVQMTSNPAWYAVQALPYLIEFPHECSEQTFNRLYANSLARHIAASDPRIRRVFDAWRLDEPRGGKALVSNLEKNEDLKNVLLLETPWVRQAANETEAKHRVGLLFEQNRLDSEQQRALAKLSQQQNGDGAWPWFPGGRSDSFITLYIVTGFGRLRHLGVKLDQGPARRALVHLDAWIDGIYRRIVADGRQNDNHLTSLIALFLYGRSFFLDDRPLGGGAKRAVDYFVGQAREHWLALGNRQSQGHLALGLWRLGERETPLKIMASLKERSVTDEELGRFWRETEHSWWWYRAPIETQAVMIEAFAEVGKDAAAVEECKVWLLKQKQTQDWKTSKATADAIYALLLRGANLLASDRLVRVSLAGTEVKPEKVEAGTGFYEQRYAAAEVKPAMGDVAVTKDDQGVAWGAVHWQYLEDMAKVTPAETNLKLKKTLFVMRDSKQGKRLHPVTGPLQVGDLLTVRLELRVDRDMEYVHLADQRGAGCEPVNVLSGYRYQDGLRYYEMTRDTASHFFIDYLPKGTYVFEYDIRIQHKGKYQTGVANIQCMYAPEFCSHSESFVLEVN